MHRSLRVILPAVATGVAVFAFIRYHDRSPQGSPLAELLERTILPIAGFTASAYLALGLRSTDRDS